MSLRKMADCCYAEYYLIILSVTIKYFPLSIIMLSIANKPFILCVIMLAVVWLSVIMLSVVTPKRQ
jgi:hypothetical protein